MQKLRENSSLNIIVRNARKIRRVRDDYSISRGWWKNREMTRREKEEEEEHADLADDPWRWIQEGRGRKWAASQFSVGKQ